MNKGIIIALIVAASLILVGGILFAAAILLNGAGLGNAELKTNTHNVSESVQSILLDTDTANVSILPALDGEVRVVCVEEDRAKHAVDVENGVLSIRVQNEKQWYDYIGFHFASPSVTVYLPSGEYGALTAKVSTGKVQIAKEFIFARMDLTASTGDVTVEASCKEDLNVKLSTGAVLLRNVSAERISLKASTGNMTLEGVRCAKAIDTEVSTGKTRMSDVRCESLTSRGSTGDVELQDVIVQTELFVKRSTGDIRFEACDTDRVELHTTTGDIEGTFLSPKSFRAHSDTGRVDVPNGMDGSKGAVDTDTGRIRIEILS